MTTYRTILHILPFLLMSCAQTGKNIEWHPLKPIPAAEGKTIQPGLAGALCGISNNHLIVAGGANFEDGLPWNGAAKIYHDAVFVLSDDENASWIQLNKKLPVPLGYSACIETERGLICAGGENSLGMVDQNLEITYTDNTIEYARLAPIPEALSNAAIAKIGQTIYLAGGTGIHGTVNSFYAFNRTENKWEKLPPLPLPLTNALLAAQNDGFETALFLFGGRCKEGDFTQFYNHIWKYSPSKRKWENTGSIMIDERPLSWAAGTGVALGDRTIYLFGGDDGILYHKTEKFLNRITKVNNEQDKNRQTELKNQHLTNHPGFNRTILKYNTQTNRISKEGEYPSPAQVTTRALLWNQKIIVPSGEIRPGIRTPEVWCGHLCKKRSK